MMLNWVSFLSLKPNEWGDFLAGSFGPLAIFWLVLGFFQQGQELRLQVKELALSVEQQKESVSVTRDALDHDQLLQREKEQARIKSIQPSFSIIASGGSQQGGHNGKITNTVTVTNTRSSASNVSLVFQPPVHAGGLNFKPFWSKGEDVRLSIQFEPTGPPEKRELRISYTDTDGQSHSLYYNFAPIEKEPTSMNVSLDRAELAASI